MENTQKKKFDINNFNKINKKSDNYTLKNSNKKTPTKHIKKIIDSNNKYKEIKTEKEKYCLNAKQSKIVSINTMKKSGLNNNYSYSNILDKKNFNNLSQYKITINNNKIKVENKEKNVNKLTNNTFNVDKLLDGQKVNVFKFS